MAGIVAVLVAILVAALAFCGCGVGFGAGSEEGRVDVVVSRDFGAAPIFELAGEKLRESDTVMRLLERGGEIETRYGGGFVQAINGLEGGSPGGRPHDWFFFVNGVEADRGSADYRPINGDRIWWDFRDWGAAMRVPAVVGQFPEPFLNGYDGQAEEVALECRGGGEACELVEASLEEVGVSLTETGDPGRQTVVYVGPWDEIRKDPLPGTIGKGPEQSGVYLRIEESGDAHEVVALDAQGREKARYGPGYGMIAAGRRGESPPFWVVSGIDPAGVTIAAGMIDEDTLAGNFAVIAGPEGPVRLPVP